MDGQQIKGEVSILTIHCMALADGYQLLMDLIFFFYIFV